MLSALLVGLVGAVVVALLRGEGHSPGGAQPAQLPSAGASAPGPTRETAATRLLFRLDRALRHGARSEAVSLAAGAAGAHQLGYVYDNVQALDLDRLSLRYVAADRAALTAAQSRRLGARGFAADVQLTWRVAGYDSGRSSLEVAFAFAETDHGAEFVSAGDAGGRSPLWLLEPLTVRHTPTCLVMAPSGPQAQGYLDQARRARRAVREVLHQWHGNIVMEVPRSEHELDRLLGSKPGEYDAIAAVTTTVDGSLDASAPAHIFVNPDVFDRLGRHGGQVVVSHEATHLATHAATAATPMWLLEGFADYVALAHMQLPLSVAGGQALAQVRRHGPPDHLPTAADFDPADKALGETYESAWLACRFLVDRYGERRLVAFYHRAQRDGSTAAAFAHVLGTTRKRFTHGWQAYLTRLAG